MANESSNPLELRFSLGPFPVTVEPTFWLLTLVLGWNIEDKARWMLPWVIICFVSILLHELGHGVTALAFGSRSRIRLYSFGGLCYPERLLSRWRHVVMCAAGPATNFLLWALSWVILNWAPLPSWYMNQVIAYAGDVNFWWGILNVMPALPLDGGQVLAGVLGPSRRRAARLIAVLTSAVVVAYALAIRDTYLALLFASLGMSNFQGLSSERDVRAQKPAPKEPDALPRAWQALTQGDEYEASRLGHLALSGAKAPAEENAARDLLAWVALAEDNPRAAIAQLELVVPRTAARSLTWAMALEAAQRYPEAARCALEAVAKEPSETSAALAVRLLVQTGQLDEAERLARTFAWKTPATRDARLGDVAFARGEFGAAAALYGAAFQAGGRSTDAYNAACGHARAGQVDLATTWLKRALNAGFDDLEKVAQDPDLAAVRAAPEMAPLLKPSAS